MISSNDEILIEPLKFTNDHDGFYLLLSKLALLNSAAASLALNQPHTTVTTPFVSLFVPKMLNNGAAYNLTEKLLILILMNLKKASTQELYES